MSDIKKPEWELRMDRLDRTLDGVGKRLDEVGKKLDKTASVVNGIGDSNGIIAEEFFMETTEEGLHIDGFGHLKQKNCNYVITTAIKIKELNLILFSRIIILSLLLR